ncbi:hypothetical protein JW905_12450 [bacterium]|nr:hypothetical protein [candidate division CSSED10-310 bacterium]
MGTGEFGIIARPLKKAAEVSYHDRMNVTAAPELNTQPRPPGGRARRAVSPFIYAVLAVSAVIIGGMIVIGLYDYLHQRDLYNAPFYSMSNNEVRFSDEAGIIIVLILFQSRNPVQWQALPQYNALCATALQRSRYSFYAIAVDAGEHSGLKQAAMNAGLRFPLLIPSTRAVRALPDLNTLPAMLLLDRTGRVVVHHQGVVNTSQLAMELRMISSLPS